MERTYITVRIHKHNNKNIQRNKNTYQNNNNTLQ